MRIALVSIKGIKHKVTKQLHGVMSLTITDAEADSLTYLKLYGGTEQKSKNLFDKDDSTMLYDGYLSNTTVGNSSKLNSYAGGDKTIFVKVNPNTVYTISRATNILTLYDRIRVASFTSKPITNTTGIMLYNLSTNTSTATAVITTLSDTEYIAINVRNSGTVGNDRQQFIDAFLVYQGTSQTPTPTAPVDITSNNGAIKYGATSKNLLDMSEDNIVLGKYIDNSGTISNNQLNFYNSKYIPVEGGETYTWSTSSVARYISIMEYDSNKTFIKRTLFTNSSTTLSDSITLDSNTAYILFGSNVDANNITMAKINAIDRQIEKGNTATSYVPYTEGIYCAGPIETVEDSLGNTATAEMLLKVGDYQDEQEVISGSVTRRLGVKVLDGTETTYSLQSQYNRVRWIGASTRMGSKKPAETANPIDILYTHFRNIAVVANMGEGGAGMAASGDMYFSIQGLNISSVSDWTDRLADQYANGTPVIIVSPLATETTESVTPQTINVRSGNNTIEITQAGLDDLELEIEYNGDPL